MLVFLYSNLFQHIKDQNSERGVRTVWMLSGIIAAILTGSFFVVLSNLKLQAHRQRNLEQLKQSHQKLKEAQNQLLTGMDTATQQNADRTKLKSTSFNKAPTCLYAAICRFIPPSDKNRQIAPRVE